MITTEPTIGTNPTFMYRLLVSSQLRWVRYLILITALGVISFNQAFIVYIDFREVLREWFYVILFVYLVAYLAVVCVNLFILLPQYLLKKRYWSYLWWLSAIMCGLIMAQMAMEYSVYSHWPQLYVKDQYFSVAMVVDYISSFVLTTLCMIGGSMTALLKVWMIDYQRVSQLEKAHILSEVEQLKEQVSPELLFNTLHYSGALALKEPEKASMTVMRLSQLLRYQLYDCSRKRVLLSGEITFLTNYLTLEKNHFPNFDYTLTLEGEITRTLVPPLLFIPFIRHVVNLAHQQPSTDSVLLHIHLKVEEDTITFTCSCIPRVNLSAEKGLESIRRRLDCLYQQNYELSLATDSICLKLKGGAL